ncbi:MAG: electron transport complex subunit RsxC [Bacteroidales bacterium]|nr:electron transport complex subunit RsxC [Bacteroidales bacterium]MBR4325715.1 electron transport complex subunit RsxC [Bacteroidales bacterium]
MELKTFKIGGVHPADKKITAAKPITPLPVPQTVTIPCAQHIGAPAEIVVQKGDKVKVGTLIAKATGFVSANIHSSVSGTVKNIGPVADASGYTKQAVTIQVEGDEWEDTIDRSPDLKRNIDDLKPEDIVAKVHDAGVVGMGGATFPTKVKLSIPLEKKADAVIINAVECEPYLTADHRVMLERGEELMIGTQLLMKAVRCENAYIGIEQNKPDAIEYLTKLSANYPGIKVVPLKLKYPQGSEKHLIAAITGRQVPSGRLPIDVGAVVDNAGTAVAVYEAVMKNKPLIERVVTVTGDSVKNPGNFLVRIGTPISALVEAVGGLPEDTGKIISGGPMMGKAITTLDIPVAKGTSGVLMLPESLAHRGEPEACIRCGKCVDACPMGLEPYLLAAYAKRKDFDSLEENHVYDCIECGCCVFSCPANRPILDFVRFGKQKVMAIMRGRNKK